MEFRGLWKNVKLKPIILVILGMILVAAYLGNRALIIGYSVSLVFIYLFHSSRGGNKKYWLIFLFFIAQTFSLAFLSKQDSSLGRVLIYKISFRILKDTFPSGISPNAFGLVYGRYQMRYFETDTYTAKELLLADNVEYCYNDYLQIVIEYGIIGLLIIFMIWATITMLIFNCLESYASSNLAWVAISQIIAIATASCFTFILYEFHWRCILMISVVILFVCSRFTFKRYGCILLFFILIYDIVSHFRVQLFHNESLIVQETALALSKSGYFQEAGVLYSTTFDKLRTDRKFIREYAKTLILAQDFRKAESLMLDLIKTDNSNVNFDILADCYRKEGNYADAEQNYLNSIHKVPNKLYSRYNLFLLYLDTRQKEKAISAGREILRLPIKVPSKNVDFIKFNVVSQLNFLQITEH